MADSSLAGHLEAIDTPLDAADVRHEFCAAIPSYPGHPIRRQGDGPPPRTALAQFGG
jgi:hypothetical protein